MEMECKIRKKSISLIDLEDDILVWIFTRLPITTILGCRRVCKSWYLFISSSYFATFYRSNPPSTSLIISNWDFFNPTFSLLELNADCNYSIKPNTPKILPNPFVSSNMGRDTKLVGSCNGFLCFAQNDMVNVTNPLSGRSFMLPNQRLEECNNSVFETYYALLRRTNCYGFGFCPKTLHYKVVKLSKYGESSKTELSVFTLGIDKSWRRLLIEDAPLPLGILRMACSADFRMQFCEVNGKGALHWIVGKMSEEVDYLYSFDISEEKVRTVPPPVGLKKRTKYTKLVFLHGCLCLLHTNKEKNIEFWFMKDYMVSDSWTLRIIPQTCLSGNVKYSWFHTVAVWENEEVFIALKQNYLYYYDLKQGDFTKIKLVLGDTDTSSTYAAATCFVPNFLPFSEVGTALGQTKDAVKEQGLLIPEVSKPTQFRDGGGSA